MRSEPDKEGFEGLVTLWVLAPCTDGGVDVTRLTPRTNRHATVPLEYGSQPPDCSLESPQELGYVAPIHRLPQELLVCTFLIAMTGGLNKTYYERLRTLMRVCRQWNGIVNGSPVLWAVVDTAFSATLIQTALEKSHTSHLAATFFDTPEDLTYTSKSELMLQHAHGWHTLQLYNTSLAFLDRVFGVPAPHLKHLLIASPRLNCHNPLRQSSFGSVNEFRGLITLSLTGCINMGLTVAQLLDVLRTTRALVELDVDEVEFSRSTLGPGDDQTPIELPDLSRFNLVDRSTEAIHTLLRCIRIPNCRDLAIEHECSPQGCSGAEILSHFTRHLVSAIHAIVQMADQVEVDIGEEITFRANANQKAEESVTPACLEIRLSGGSCAKETGPTLMKMIGSLQPLPILHLNIYDAGIVANPDSWASCAITTLAICCDPQAWRWIRHLTHPNSPSLALPLKAGGPHRFPLSRLRTLILDNCDEGIVVPLLEMVRRRYFAKDSVEAVANRLEVWTKDNFELPALLDSLHLIGNYSAMEESLPELEAIIGVGRVRWEKRTRVSSQDFITHMTYRIMFQIGNLLSQVPHLWKR